LKREPFGAQIQTAYAKNLNWANRLRGLHIKTPNIRIFCSFKSTYQKKMSTPAIFDNSGEATTNNPTQTPNAKLLNIQ
jgi:hypothetical protein